MRVTRSDFDEALSKWHGANGIGATTPEIAAMLGSRIDEANRARQRSKPPAKIDEGGEIVKRNGWTVWVPAGEA